jgi:hypothetical protein
MSSPALLRDASAPRVLVLDGSRSHDVFDVLSFGDEAPSIIRVRSPFLFEIGEVLALRIERGESVSDARARVRAHTGPDDARITELEVTQHGEPRPMVTG